jgi:beta-glucanase (GH16 family)
VLTRTRLGVGGLTIAVAAALTAAAVAMAPVRTDTVVSAPFRWQGATWCPVYRGIDGCDNVQKKGTNSSTPFYPSQVTRTGNSDSILLKVNSAATETGAFNSRMYETWEAPATLSEQITLPCNFSGQIDNWPAFWLVTTNAWPAGGEIDVIEGLHGIAAWHYHYLNSSGASSSVGGEVSGFSGCGTHTYGVNWTRSAITFYYDGRLVGKVTPTEIGVPIAAGPMYAVNDYATSPTYGGPTTGDVEMEVLKFTAAIHSST